MATREAAAIDPERERRRLYRYRTKALLGPWRATRGEAMGDALRARQARPDEVEPESIRWIVDGRIEERQDHPTRF